MGADPVSFDKHVEEDPFEDKDHLLSLLDEYQDLAVEQQEERKALLDKIEELTKRTEKIDNMDLKLQQFLGILLEIKTQISGEPEAKDLVPRPKILSSPEILASEQQIEELEQEVESQHEKIDDEIDSLVLLLDKKKEQLQQKDQTIEELNDKLDMLTDEKGRLSAELENLNEVIDSWKNQLDLLQKLAASDPRYRVIEALKKHGTLSDIQLAFTMGTSINQLRKYIEDLIELKLVKKAPNGRFVWTGKDFEADLDEI
ncbi:MAG: hypothetical protein ACXAE3_14040 [Candidatus Kariarchaeaceae archaeon]|jgi:chromosome segregation ATPase